MIKSLMKSAVIFGWITCLLLLSCSQQTTPPVSTRTGTEPVPARPSGSSTIENGILANINAYRRSKGLAELKMVDAASQQAEIHSRNMATGKTGFGHDGFSQRVTNTSSVIGRVSAAAENVAFGSETAREVVDGWLKSAPHKKNIEGDYNLTGIGVYANSKGVSYFTQLFLKQ
jgi:uncharacterized protein YkwD